MGLIIIVSHPGDPHATAVLEFLRQYGHAPLMLNLSNLPHDASITVEYHERNQPRIHFVCKDGTYFDLDDVTSLWWRRPQFPNLETITDPHVRVFTANEWNHALNGLWQLIEAPWMNPPAPDQNAIHKALQLKIAQKVGLRIPRTLITSDPNAAREFCLSQGIGRTIYKAFSCTREIWCETRLLGRLEFDSLEHLRLAPVIFQECIAPALDIRVTVVGDHIFPAAIYLRETDYPFDFRMNLGQARIEPVELPFEVITQLRDMMQRLQLVYGAFDLRRTADGQYVFLEINPGGEFLFIEQHTRQPITRAVADWLVTPTFLRDAQQ